MGRKSVQGKGGQGREELLVTVNKHEINLFIEYKVKIVLNKDGHNVGLNSDPRILNGQNSIRLKFDMPFSCMIVFHI